NILTGDFVGVEPLVAMAHERLRTTPVPAVYMLADVGASVAYTNLGRWQDAVRAAQDGYERGKAMANDGVASFCDAFTAFPYICQGDWSRAIEHTERALAKAPTVYFRGWPQLYLAAAHCASGQGDSALDTLASILEFTLSVRHELGYLPSAPLLGSAYISAGQYEKARVLLEQLVARADQCGAKWTRGSARRLLAEVAMHTDPEQRQKLSAAALFERSVEELKTIGAENDVALALAGYGRLLRRVGDVVKARELLTEAKAIFERL